MRRCKPKDGINIDIELKTGFQRILFENYFQIENKMDNKIVAACKRCKSISKSNMKCGGLLQHLKVCKIDFCQSINDVFVIVINI